MGVETGGGMILGAGASAVGAAVYDEESELYIIDGDPDEGCEELWEWIDYHDMRTYSYYYDAPEDGQVAGFEIEDIGVLSEGFHDWVEDVKIKAKSSKRLQALNRNLLVCRMFGEEK